jgi:RimJ/RimL family protein N-acetyltransferase
MSERARNLVDGIGVERITTNLHTSVTNDHLVLRPAGWDDVELLWRWANDPAVRENSFHPEPITQKEHVEWYKTKLMSPNTCIWILECDQIPVAQIRYDRVDGESAEIDFSVAHDYRGRGLGTKLLILTSNIACHNLNVEHLKGVVFSHNLASSHAFIKAGFRCVDRDVIINGKRCDIYVRNCREIIGGVENVTVH